MNILRPAKLKRNALLRLVSALSKHDVTKIVIHCGDDVQQLYATNAKNGKRRTLLDQKPQKGVT